MSFPVTAPRREPPTPNQAVTGNAGARPAASSAITIRTVVLADYPQIAAVQARGGIEPKSQEEWEHLWVNNPVYKKCSAWTIGWVAENTAGEIVGYVGNIPLSFSLQGREILCGCGYAIAMDEAYRGSAGFLARRFLHQKNLDLLITTSANPNSNHLNKGFRQPRVPAGDWGQATFWVTNYRGFVGSVLSKRGWPTLLAYPAAAALAMKDRLVRRHAWTRRNCDHIEMCSTFDERFDAFWDELKRSYPERLLADRSREALQWHFKYALAQEQVWIATLRDHSRLLAYAVFRRRDASKHTLKRMQLVDFQTLDGDMHVLADMLAWGFTRCRSEGIHTLEEFGFRADKQAVVDSLRPYHRHLPSWWYSYKPLNPTLGQILLDPAVWDPSHYDGDAAL